MFFPRGTKNEQKGWERIVERSSKEDYGIVFRYNWMIAWIKVQCMFQWPDTLYIVTGIIYEILSTVPMCSLMVKITSNRKKKNH